MRGSGRGIVLLSINICWFRSHPGADSTAMKLLGRGASRKSVCGKNKVFEGPSAWSNDLYIPTASGHQIRQGTSVVSRVTWGQIQIVMV